MVTHRCSDKGARFSALSHIEAADRHLEGALLPALLRDRIQLIDSAGAQNQVGLLAGKRERGGLADATRCARDDDDRPLEPHVGILGAAVKSGHEGAHVPR